MTGQSHPNFGSHPRSDAGSGPGFDALLTVELQQAAVTLPIAADADVAPILHRGAARQRRQRRVALVSTLAVLAVFTAGTVAAIGAAGRDRAPLGDGSIDASDRSNSSETLSTTAPTTVSPMWGDMALPRPEPITPIDPLLAWSRTDIHRDQALQHGMIVGTGPFYAISTAPSSGASPQHGFDPALYRSDDGMRWDQISNPGNSMLSMAVNSRGLYVVGTAPTPDRAGFGTRLDHSPDGGETWSTLGVDFGVGELNKDPAVIHTHAAAQLAASEAGLAVIVTRDVHLDPAGLPGVDPEWGWQATAEGILVRGTERCTRGLDSPGSAPDGTPWTTAHFPADCFRPSATGTVYPWDVLTIGPAVRQALLEPILLMFSPDGVEFVSIDPAAVGLTDDFPMVSLIALDTGFALLTSSMGDPSVPARLATSRDGLSWEVRDLDFARAGAWVVESLSSFGNTLVLASASSLGQSVSVSLDGGATWTTTALAGLLTAADGPDPRFGTSVFATAGPSGITAWVGIDPGGPTLTSEDGQPAIGETLILHSLDGVDWSRQWLDDLAGTAVSYPSTLVDGPGGVVLLSTLVADPQHDDESPAPAIALRGVLR